MQDLAEAGHFVTRASKVLPHTNLKLGQQTGLSAGQAPLHMTIYDKLEAHMGKCDRLYVQGMIDRRWGGIVPDSATRIEFQIGRSWLRDNGISSPADFQRLAGSVVHKLTQKWFRLTERPVDRANKNQSRAGIHPLWKSIQQAFKRVYGQPEGDLVPINREAVHPSELIIQGRGCLLTAVLQKGKLCKTYDDFVEAAVQLLQDIGGTVEEKLDFMQTLRNRATEYLT